MERIHDVEIRVTLVERAMIGNCHMTPIDWLEDAADMGEPELAKISTKILKNPRAELKLQYDEAFIMQRSNSGEAFISGVLDAIKAKLKGAFK